MTINPLFPNRQPNFKTRLATDRQLLKDYWNQFVAEFPTEEDCVNELYRLIYRHRLRCPECHTEKIRRLFSCRVIICCECKIKTHTLAGTFFHNIRRAQCWLAAIWFMEHGIEISASSFARLANLVSSSAQEIFKKLSLVVINKMSRLPEISSADFVFVFRRRSRITPAGRGPASEQDDIEKSIDANSKKLDETASVDAAPSQTKTEFDDGNANPTGFTDEKIEFLNRERTVLAAMSSEPVYFDVLQQIIGMDTGKLIATLVFLELKGVVKRDQGNWYWLAETAPAAGSAAGSFPENQAKNAVASFYKYVISIFNGISRKYLQNYLAWYWCIVDRKRWKPGALLKECSRFRKIGHEDILHYVSPTIVKLSPVPTA